MGKDKDPREESKKRFGKLNDRITKNLYPDKDDRDKDDKDKGGR